MKPAFAHIDSSTEIAAPVADVFAHWMGPDARQRYEAPPESGMRYRGFATEQGGVEEVGIFHEGAQIGEMTQRLIVLDAPHLIISQIAGTFAGKTTLVMQVTVHFTETETGTRIHGTGQVVDATGREVQDEHEAGWQELFAKFCEDFVMHGPGT